MSGLTYLITGANRGIGKGLLSTLILRPETTVIAAVRDVAFSKKTLSSIPVGPGSKLIVVKIDSTSATDPVAAVEELKTQHGISKIDVLVSNGGIMDFIGTVLDTPADKVRKHFEINTLGPMLLIQAFYPLLDASAAPKFLIISSGIGSNELLAQYKVTFFAYGVSKAAVNYLARKLHFENERLTIVAYSPGWVQTEMGSGAARGVEMEDAPLGIDDSVRGLGEQFDAATPGNSGGFYSQEGEVMPW